MGTGRQLQPSPVPLAQRGGGDSLGEGAVAIALQPQRQDPLAADRHMVAADLGRWPEQLFDRDGQQRGGADNGCDWGDAVGEARNATGCKHRSVNGYPHCAFLIRHWRPRSLEKSATYTGGRMVVAAIEAPVIRLNRIDMPLSTAALKLVVMLRQPTKSESSSWRI